MSRFLLIVLIFASSWVVAHDLVRAAPPIAEALWELLGNVATINIEVQSSDVESVLIVTIVSG